MILGGCLVGLKNRFRAPKKLEACKSWVSSFSPKAWSRFVKQAVASMLAARGEWPAESAETESLELRPFVCYECGWSGISANALSVHKFDKHGVRAHARAWAGRARAGAVWGSFIRVLS